MMDIAKPPFADVAITAADIETWARVERALAGKAMGLPRGADASGAGGGTSPRFAPAMRVAANDRRSA